MNWGFIISVVVLVVLLVEQVMWWNRIIENDMPRKAKKVASTFGGLLALLLLSGCGEAAQCWNHIQSRATSCEQMRLDEIERNRQERER